jgi:hypothetical protein
MTTPTSDSAGIRQTIRALLAAGHTLDYVYDGEDEVKVTIEREAIDAITAVDQAHLHVTLPNGARGWVFFVLGNDPEEVICDHTTNLSPVLDPLIDSWM